MAQESAPVRNPGLTLVCVDLSAIAAFTAAGLSLVNVAVSYRLSSQGHLEQWRREQERPIVARILTLSRDATKAWMDTASAKEDLRDRYQAAGFGAEDAALRKQMAEHWARGNEVHRDMRFETEQLDLLAGPQLRKVARDLTNKHDSARINLRPAGPNDQFNHYFAIEKLERALREAARADLGLREPTRRSVRALLRRAADPHGQAAVPEPAAVDVSASGNA